MTLSAHIGYIMS